MTIMENQLVVFYKNQQRNISLPSSTEFKHELLSAFDIPPTAQEGFRIYYQCEEGNHYLHTIDDFNLFIGYKLTRPLIIEEEGQCEEEEREQLINLKKDIPKDIDGLIAKLMPILTNLSETINNHELRIKKVEALCDQLLNRTAMEEMKRNSNSNRNSNSILSKKVPLFSNTNTSTNSIPRKELNQLKKKLLEEIVLTKSVHDYIYFALEVTRKKVLMPKNTNEDENVIKWNQDHIFKYTIELNELKEKANHLKTDPKEKIEFKFSSKQKGSDIVDKRIDVLKNEIARLEKDIVYRYNKLKNADEDKDASVKYKMFLNSELMNRKAHMTMKERELLSIFN